MTRDGFGACYVVATTGRPVRVSVRSARYANFNPDNWWHTRDGQPHRAG